MSGTDRGGSQRARLADPAVLIVAMTLGIVAIQAAPELPGLPLLCVLAASALPRWRGRVLWGATVLGMMLATLQAQRYLEQRWPAARDGEPVRVAGWVMSLPEPEAVPGDRGRTWRFAFEPDAGHMPVELPERIRVSWYRSEVTVRGGQCWQLLLRMRSPHGSANPGGFDYERWLMQGGFGATASVREAQPCATPASGGLAPGRAVLRLRQAISDRIHEVLGSGPAPAILAALVVGDTGGMSDADWQRFRRTGTTHLIAISGFNLAIISGFAFFVLRWGWSGLPRACLLWPAQKVAAYGALVVAAFYALLAGFEPPVVRAWIMTAFVVVALATDRVAHPVRTLLYAWGLILLVDPVAVLSPGLWLSFGAVAAIFYVVRGRWRSPHPWLTALRVQLFLSLVLVPLTVHFFDGFSYLAPFANLIAVPVFAVLTPLAFVAVGLAMVTTQLGDPALQLAGILLGWVDAGLAVAARAPAAWVPASAGPVALLMGLVGTVLLFVPRGVPLRPLAAVCVLPLIGSSPKPVSGLSVTALDVGQGLAVVVRTATHTLLFDAGPAYAGGFDAGRSVVVPYLLEQGVRRVDRLLISHGDNDHAGGADAVGEMLAVGIAFGATTAQACVDGQTWTWDGVRFSILHPGGGTWKDNDRSCVLRVEGPFTALLPGDIERGAEQRLLREHAAELRADLLLSPHHGSHSSSSAPFVAAVAPAVVVHAAGWHNRFGHPRAEVTRRYAHAGARQYVTGALGAIEVRQAQDGLRVQAWREQSRRWWRAPPSR
ncbi:MAG: DNA internalization-related competence protein ComEC/Rec2 [Nevskiales bacterium]|nr:DNA internalization-related competence protein ComEC/Rec2 [Nevskiales bacterium]